MGRKRRGCTISFDDFAFGLGYVVNPAGVDLVSGSEETLPSGHWIGAYDRTL